MTIKKFALGLLLAVFLVGVLGFLVLPPLVKATLVEKLSDALHRPVAIKGLSINPYTWSVQVAGLAIQEKGGGETVAAFDSLDLKLNVSSLLRGAPVVRELKLAGPQVKLVRLADGRFNFSDLIDEFMAKPPSDDPTPSFSVNNIQISGGRLAFDDRTLGETHLVSEINIALPFVSSLPDATEIFVEPAFSAAIDGSPLVVKGRAKPFAGSQESELALDLRDVQLGRYLDYLPIRLPIELISGALESDLKLSFRRHEKKDDSTLTLSGSLAVKDLEVKDRAGSPLLSLKRLEVLVGAIDPLRKEFRIDRVALDSPTIHARVSRQGTINWVDFFSKELAAQAPSEAQAESAPLEWSLGEATVSGGAVHWLDESKGKPFNASVEGLALVLKNLDSRGNSPAQFEVAWRLDAGEWIKNGAISIKGGILDLAKRELFVDQFISRGTKALIRRAANGSIEFVEAPHLKAVEASQKDSSGPWKLTVAKYRGEDLGVRFEDRAVTPAVTHTIEAMRIEADNLSTAPGTTATVATRFRLNNKGDVEIGGRVGIFPLDADLKLSVKTLELLPLQPYFTERLNIALTRGQVTLDGGFQLRQPNGGAVDVGKLSGGFSGQLTVGDFQAVDKINSADFLKWKSLHLGHLDLRLNPNSVSIGEVALADFFARLILSREGQLNLLQIVRQPVATTAAAGGQQALAKDGKSQVAVAGSGGPGLPVKVGKVTLQGGNIKFTDNFVKPNYSANLKKVGGTLSGFSSAADSVATLELRGSYDNVAPLSVTAKFKALTATPYLDLEADVKGIELTSLSPYSGKYAGYAIERGKLSLFVKYKIENNLLTAENRVFLDQLTFGEPVKSPDATNLPVTLAVALLKNHNGEIDINLPISGSLNEPEFSVGGLIVKVIVNLLAKAVTAPFALLGSAFGGGEELSNVEFEVGRAAITAPAEKRLEPLAKALLDRPSLKLDIEGCADPDNDPEGLKRARLERKVRAQKREELAKKGLESDSAEASDVAPNEYPMLLERVYRAEKFPKPRNVIGIVKGLPVEEMEKLILANTVVDEEDLRELADRRAKGVRDWLVGRAVPPERLFMLPVKLANTNGKVTGGATTQAGGSRVLFSLK